MSVIENFAELSIKEQKDFADTIVKTINSKSIFTNETHFKVSEVEADDISGMLIIHIEHDDLIEVSRKATWTCTDEDELDSDPGYDADYDDYLYKDAEKSFKTLSTVIDGYKVSLQVDDADEEETVEVKVTDYSHEDSGIGDYEFWGDRGYDSHPYLVVEGTIVKGCNCALSLFVEPEE